MIRLLLAESEFGLIVRSTRVTIESLPTHFKTFELDVDTPPWVEGVSWTLMFLILIFSKQFNYVSKTPSKMRSAFTNPIHNGVWRAQRRQRAIYNVSGKTLLQNSQKAKV